MRWTSMLAIFTLFWVLSAFLVLPFGVRTPEDVGERADPGHAESAPVHFRPGMILRRATAVAVLVFGLFYLNYVEGWYGVGDLNIFGDGPLGYHDPTYG